MFDVSVTPEQSSSVKAAISDVLPLIEHHDSRYPSIFLDNYIAIAANSKALLEKPHEVPIPARISLPKIEATIIAETRSDLVRIAGRDDHAEFHFEDGLVIRIPPLATVLEASYPKQGRLESVLLACNLYTPIPESFKARASAALKASGKQGQVIIGRGKIRSFNRHNAEVSSIEFDDPNQAFATPIKLDSEQLAMALPHMAAATVWGDARGMSFTDGGMRGSVMGTTSRHHWN